MVRGSGSKAEIKLDRRREGQRFEDATLLLEDGGRKQKPGMQAAS